MTEEKLIKAGKKIQNVKITNVSLNFKNYSCFELSITLEGGGYGVVYGGYVLGKAFIEKDYSKCSFEGSAKGMEAIMRIMEVIGVDDLFDCKGKYARIAFGSWGDTVAAIGNITEDKWFDYKEFFKNDIGIEGERK